jgi:hypothetical protein
LPRPKKGVETPPNGVEMPKPPALMEPNGVETVALAGAECTQKAIAIAAMVAWR